MKHIAKNRIISIVASAQDGNFPAENMLDEHPGRPWKAGGINRTASLTIQVSGGCSDVAFFGTDAKEATFSAYDPNQLSLGPGLAMGGGLVLGNVGLSVSGSVEVLEKTGALWLSFSPAIIVPCIVEVNLESAGNEQLYAGVAVAATADEYEGATARYGATWKRKDNSVENVNKRGFRYYKKTTLPKILTISARMPKAAFLRLDAITGDLGRIPTAWNLIEGESGWLTFGYLETIEASYDYRNHVNITMTINEVI